MRGNGLSAESYVAIGDLDPVIAEAMLGVLREAKVAAYTEPCPPAPGAFLEVRLPQIPCDRLYVDETAEVRARSLLDEHLPALRETSADREPVRDSEDDTTGAEPAAADRSLRTTFDDDQAWAEIVARFDLPAGDEVGRWPASEDIEPETSGGASGAGSRDAGSRDAGSRDAGSTDAGTSDAGTTGATKDVSDSAASNGTHGGSGVESPGATADQGGPAPDPAAERYVPPPPPPLPPLDMPTKGAWLAMAGGLVLLLLAAVAGAYVPTWFAFVGVVAFISGFLILVVRMKGGPPDDEDGAIV